MRFPWSRDNEPALPIETEVKLIEAPRSPILTPPPSPVIEITTTIGTGPYSSNAEHIRDELARIDQLVRAQVIRWRNSITPDKPPEDWGMARLSEREIEAY